MNNYQVKEGVDGWSRDENGELVRRIGNVIEHAPQFIGVGPHSETVEKEQEEIIYKYCPFRNGLNTTCSRDCPLFLEKACALKVSGANTNSGYCTIRKQVCSSDCAIWANGCGIVGIVKNLKERIENE